MTQIKLKLRREKRKIEKLKEDLTQEEKKFMVEVLTDIVAEEIGKEKAKELKEKIIKEEKSNMVTENLRNIFRMNYNEGVQCGIKTRRKTRNEDAEYNEE